jgi:hypothetical protein
MLPNFAKDLIILHWTNHSLHEVLLPPTLYVATLEYMSLQEELYCYYTMGIVHMGQKQREPTKRVIVMSLLPATTSYVRMPLQPACRPRHRSRDPTILSPNAMPRHCHRRRQQQTSSCTLAHDSSTLVSHINSLTDPWAKYLNAKHTGLFLQMGQRQKG